MSSPRIAITRPLPTAAEDLLAAVGVVATSPAPDRPLTRGELVEHVRAADAVVSMLYDRIDEEVMTAAGPSLRVVANVAVGFENIDLAAAERLGITVTNTPGVLTDATADLTLALMLMVMRRLGEGERLLRSQAPWHWDLGFHLGTGLHGRTLGIVGLGAIGTAVARRASVCGMRILYTRNSDRSEPTVNALRVALPTLLAESDVVTLHCPLNAETFHLIDAEALRMMKPGAYLVNTARGPIVDESALVDALRERRLAGAALDVFEHEPQIDQRLLEFENVVVTPHLGSATFEVRSEMALLAAKNVAAVLEGGPALTPVAHEQ